MIIKVIEKLPIDKNLPANYLSVFTVYDGTGNPNDDHKLIGYGFLDQNDNCVRSTNVDPNQHFDKIDDLRGVNHA